MKTVRKGDLMYYKVLGRGHRACHGGQYRYTKGRWTKRIASPVACRTGYHVVTAAQLARWLTCNDEQLPLEVWECEAEGAKDNGNKHVAERVRLTRLIGTLDARDLRLLAADFAEDVLPLFESVLPNDGRPRAAIAASRDFADGLIDEDTLRAAERAAEAAGRAAGAAGRAAEAAGRAHYGQMVLDYLAKVAPREPGSG